MYLRKFLIDVVDTTLFHALMIANENDNKW